VFDGLVRNPTFIFIFCLTLVLQIILINFGGKVFHLNEDGLDLIGWLVSIILGTGSLVVGLFVRVLPPLPLPAWLCAEELVKDEIQPDAPYNRSQDLWKVALTTTRMQVGGKRFLILVVRAFQLPSRSSMGANSLRPQAIAIENSNWSLLRKAFTTGHFTRRNDYSNIIVADHRQVRAARVRLARQVKH
jgi:hypothetical protein